MNDLDFHIGQLVIANRILANEGVVDAYGRQYAPSLPSRTLPAVVVAQSRAGRARRHHGIHPGGGACQQRRSRALSERFIHGAIYEVRPDVHAVVHAHAEDVLPFSITTTPLRPVIHSDSFMGAHVPVGTSPIPTGIIQPSGKEHVAGP